MAATASAVCGCEFMILRCFTVPEPRGARGGGSCPGAGCWGPPHPQILRGRQVPSSSWAPRVQTANPPSGMGFPPGAQSLVFRALR